MTAEKTRDQIDHLKRAWAEDGDGDLENTDGFEAHYSELLAFRLVKEREWQKAEQASASRHQNLVLAKATELECSKPLAEYILNLEQRLVRAENQIRNPGH
jgi:hypothetical protein